MKLIIKPTSKLKDVYPNDRQSAGSDNFRKISDFVEQG